MSKVLLILVLICKVLFAKSSWTFEENYRYGCNDTHEYRPGLYGLCLKEPYIVHQWHATYVPACVLGCVT